VLSFKVPVELIAALKLFQTGRMNMR